MLAAPSGVSAGYRIQGVIENNGGTTSFIGSSCFGPYWRRCAWVDAGVTADDTNDTLVIQVNGAVGATIRWVATVRTAEVAW